MLIRELARQTGLSVHTIRFYEQKGLIDPAHVKRLRNGYRDYCAAVLDRLRLVKSGQRLGFSLTQIYRSIREWETGKLTDPDKIRLFQEKIALIDKQMAEFEQTKSYLLEKIAQLDRQNL